MPQFSYRLLGISGVVVALLVTAGVFFFASTPAGSRFQASRYAERARALLQGGSQEAARVAALHALKLDRDNVAAMRVVLATGPAGDWSHELLARSRIADLDPSDAGNIRQLGLVAVTAGRYELAWRAVHDLEAQQRTAEALELRARLGAALGNFTEAAATARRLLHRDPQNPAGRLILAVAQAVTGPNDALAAAEEELRELAAIPSLRIEALRGLRQAAIRRGAPPAALEIAEAIVADPHSHFADKLARAALLAQAHPERLGQTLDELSASAGDDERAFGLIATWLSSTGRGHLIEAWAQSNPHVNRHRATSETLRAKAMMQRQAWDEAIALLEPSSWGELDFLRHAFLARAYRHQGTPALQAQAWLTAVKSAQASPDAAQVLADATQDWPEWQQARTDFLWDVHTKDPLGSTWALTALAHQYEADKDVRGLQRVSEALLKLQPANFAIQNNAAFYTLLLDPAAEPAHRSAEELYRSKPHDPVIASTYALSLMARGRASEALAALEALASGGAPPEGVTLYRALALAAVGRTAEAQTLSKTLDRQKLLPEENRLLQEAGLGE